MTEDTLKFATSIHIRRPPIPPSEPTPTLYQNRNGLANCRQLTKHVDLHVRPTVLIIDFMLTATQSVLVLEILQLHGQVPRQKLEGSLSRGLPPVKAIGCSFGWKDEGRSINIDVCRIIAIILGGYYGRDRPGRR